MEAVGGFTADRAEQPGAGAFASAHSAGPASFGATALHSVPAVLDAVDQAIAVLDSDAVTAEDTALWGFGRSADFADRVERLSRRVEHLQVAAAGAVERSRTAALAAAAAPLVPDAVSAETAAGGYVDADPDADGARNTVEFLRTRLGIGACEARRRLTLADSILPRPGFGGQQLPPRYEELAAAASTGQVSSRAATTITLALDRARHFTTPARTAQMEHELTVTAVDNDADFLTQIARHWAEALDQDGTEPSEPALPAMNTATNPRTPTPNGNGNGDRTGEGTGGECGESSADTVDTGTAAA